MPGTVALATVAGGTLVCAFGAVLAFVDTASDESPSPVATLQPAEEDAQSRARGIAGRVLSASRDPVGGVPVFLVPLFESKDVDELETSTDGSGAFRFDDVPVDPGSPYVAEAEFDGTRFPSQILRTSDDDVTLSVAPVTKKDGDLVVAVDSLALVGDRNAVQVVHALSVENTGSRAYIGPLRLPLLRGAAAIQEGAGLDRRHLELDDTAMISRTPLLPGRHDLTYTYVTPMSKDGITFDREVTLPTKRFEVLAAGEIGLGSSGLRDGGEVTLGPRGATRTYERLSADDLEAGRQISGVIEVSADSSPVRIVVPIAAAVAALLLLAVPLIRRRRSIEPPRTDAAQADPATQKT